MCNVLALIGQSVASAESRLHRGSAAAQAVHVVHKFIWSRFLGEKLKSLKRDHFRNHVKFSLEVGGMNTRKTGIQHLVQRHFLSHSLRVRVCFVQNQGIMINPMHYRKIPKTCIKYLEMNRPFIKHSAINFIGCSK